MKKVLLLTDKPFAQVAIDGIQKAVTDAGYELKLCEKYGTDMARVKRVAADVDALIIRSDKVTPEIMDAAPNLKIIVRAGAGYDNVDLEAATQRGICVMNTPGQNSNAVAELGFGMMVMAVRNMYNGTSGFELKGKKLGIHAYGNVGRNVARIAKGFGMEIYAYDAYCPKEAIEDLEPGIFHGMEKTVRRAERRVAAVAAFPDGCLKVGNRYVGATDKLLYMTETVGKTVLSVALSCHLQLRFVLHDVAGK